MDGQPDIVSFEPRRGTRWAGLGRGGWTAIFVLLACLGAGAYLGLLVAHKNDTINRLQTALRQVSQPTAAAAAGALPVESGNAMTTFPDAAGGSFSMVAAAVRPRPGSAPLTWLFVYGQHARPGERYGLLEGTCGGQYVTASDMADGTADKKGDLAIVAPNLDIDSSASTVWVLVYRLTDGVTMGGIQGPLIGTGARAFRSAPPC